MKSGLSLFLTNAFSFNAESNTKFDQLKSQFGPNESIICSFLIKPGKELLDSLIDGEMEGCGLG